MAAYRRRMTYRLTACTPGSALGPTLGNEYGRGSIDHSYLMHGQPLSQVSCEKDLGVVFSKDLKVRQQCEEAYKKASQMLGFIHRTIRFKNPAVFIALCKSLVRPHLEYCFSGMESVLCQRQSLAGKSATPLYQNV